MSRCWKYIEPGEDGSCVEHILSEDEIIAVYFEHWKGRMIEAGRGNLISERKCIEDWVCVNWATEVCFPK